MVRVGGVDLLAADSGARRTLVETAGVTSELVRPDWSPDGRMIAFAGHAPGGGVTLPA